ncbi:MAG: MFS transporter [Actinobacteria bacterium]|nr:MFS transporter [Actinomycetota bacterium]
MTSLEIEHPYGSSISVEELLLPRDDVVAEVESSPGTFDLAHGPFLQYERTVTVDESSGTVTERINYQLAIPWFGWAYALPVRHALRNHRTSDKQPWWAPSQRLDARAASIIGTLAAAAVLTGFLGNTFSQMLTFAADEFDLGRSGQGVASAIVRIGPLLAIGLVIMADRRGRRLIAIIATAGGAVASILGAFAPNLELFVAAQLVTRTFSAALGTVILVYAVEEMPSGSRAYALSVLGMASALGAGIVLWVLPLAALDVRSWRLVLLVPIIALPLARSFWKHLPESRWFGEGAATATLRDHRAALGGLMVITFLIAFYLSPVDQFRNEFLRDERGFEPWQITLFVTTTATPGGLGLLIAGRMADSIGRRIVLVFATIGGLGALTLVFNTSGALMWSLALVAAIVSSGLLPSLGVYRAELFPTRVRNQAVAWVTISAVIGAVLGLLLTGWLSERWNSIGSVIAVLWIGPVLAVAFAWWWLPETTNRDLDDINPEDRASQDRG